MTKRTKISKDKGKTIPPEFVRWQNLTPYNIAQLFDYLTDAVFPDNLEKLERAEAEKVRPYRTTLEVLYRCGGSSSTAQYRDWSRNNNHVSGAAGLCPKAITQRFLDAKKNILESFDKKSRCNYRLKIASESRGNGKYTLFICPLKHIQEFKRTIKDAYGKTGECRAVLCETVLSSISGRFHQNTSLSDFKSLDRIAEASIVGEYEDSADSGRVQCLEERLRIIQHLQDTTDEQSHDNVSLMQFRKLLCVYSPEEYFSLSGRVSLEQIRNDEICIPGKWKPLLDSFPDKFGVVASPACCKTTLVGKICACLNSSVNAVVIDVKACISFGEETDLVRLIGDGLKDDIFIVIEDAHLLKRKYLVELVRRLTSLDCKVVVTMRSGYDSSQKLFEGRGFTFFSSGEAEVLGEIAEWIYRRRAPSLEFSNYGRGVSVEEYFREVCCAELALFGWALDSSGDKSVLDESHVVYTCSIYIEQLLQKWDGRFRNYIVEVLALFFFSQRFGHSLRNDVIMRHLSISLGGHSAVEETISYLISSGEIRSVERNRAARGGPENPT